MKSTRATARAADPLAGRAGQAEAQPGGTSSGSGGNLAIQRLAAGRPAGAGGLGMLAGGGSGALGRLHTKLAVSQPNDPLEREADEVAANVAASAATAAGGVGGRQAAAGRTPLEAAGAQPGEPTLARLADGGAGAGAGAGTADSGDDGAGAALEALVAATGPGAPLAPAVRAAIEPHLGVALDGVRVHSGEAAAAAAAALGARAFAHGNDIFLGPGESPGDLALMAHEATHVAQQRPDLVLREATDYVPDFILDGLRDLASEYDGYDTLTVAFGYDPIAGQEVARSPQNVVEALLKLLPFGSAMVTALGGLHGVMQDAVAMIDSGLTEHGLTRERLSNEIDQAWNELDPLEGLDNIDIITRHIDAVLRDVEAFVRSIIDQVIELIREAAVGLAEDQLADSELWVLATEVLGRNPLTDDSVDAPPARILADFLRFIEQEDVLAQLQERQQLDTTATWLAVQITRFAALVGELAVLFEAAWAAIQPANIGNLFDDLSKVADDAVGVVGRITAFGAEILAAALEFVKASLLGYLSEQAADVPGYPLLTVLIEEDPFTDKPVQRTPEALIGGFIKLMPDGERTYAELSESGVIGQAAGRIESAIGRLGISPQMIADTFLGVWNSMTLADLVDPGGTYDRVIARFGDPIDRIVEFVGEVVRAVVTLILEAMNFPSQLLGNIVSNAMSAIDDIERDPVGFLLNMLEALKNGLSGFFDNVVTYLTDGLSDWLFRGLDEIGVTAPSELTLESVLDLVMQVLGVTAETLWTKLGERIGPERVEQMRAAIDTATGAWAFIKDVQENGPAAIWEYVGDQLSGLWDTLLTAAKDWIVTEIVETVTAKLISMLDPTGVMAVVNSFVAFFNAIESAIEYLTEILQIVDQYVATLAAVAKGDTGPGAQMVERGLGDAVPVAIGFMANQAGIGNVPEKLVEIIEGIRELIDQAVDWLFDQAIQLGQAALSTFGGPGADPAGVDPAAAVDAAAADPVAAVPAVDGTDQLIHETFSIGAEGHELYEDPASVLMVKSDPQPVSDLDRLRRLHQQYQTVRADGTVAQRKVIIDQMITLIKSDPTLIAQLADEKLGDPPNLGDVGPHGRQTKRFQPPPGKEQFAALWELESEHVIPKQFLGSFFDEASAIASERDGPKLKKISNTEYRNLTTVMIYKVAADLKTDSIGGDLAKIRELGERFGKWIRTMHADRRAGEPISDFDDDARFFLSELAEHFHSVLPRTLSAVDREWQTRAEQRGHEPGEAGEKLEWLKNQVRAAHETQLPEMVALLDERISDASGT